MTWLTLSLDINKANGILIITKLNQGRDMIGLGGENIRLVVYVENPPALAPYNNLTAVRPLVAEEISYIGDNTSNHWRKIFNVYAKFIFELRRSLCWPSWQAYRDGQLLQCGDDNGLLFSTPQLASDSLIHVIAGRGYAQKLIGAGLDVTLDWLDQDFAIDGDKQVVVCPYFDYRQLSNVKITKLVQLLEKLAGK